MNTDPAKGTRRVS